MFGRRFRSESRETLESNERLSALLHEWKDIEPQANFEAAVWRRIRAVSTPEQRRFTTATTLEWFTPHPVWVNAMAVAAGIAVGVGLAFSTPAMRDIHQTDETLLRSQTLAGSYLAMLAEGTR
jgi:hypothetical protein